MDFMLFFFCGLHTIVFEIKQKHHKKLWYPLVTKNLGRPTDHLGGSLGHPEDLTVTSGDRRPVFLHTVYMLKWLK